MFFVCASACLALLPAYALALLLPYSMRVMPLLPMSTLSQCDTHHASIASPVACPAYRNVGSAWRRFSPAVSIELPFPLSRRQWRYGSGVADGLEHRLPVRQSVVGTFAPPFRRLRRSNTTNNKHHHHHHLRYNAVIGR